MFWQSVEIFSLGIFLLFHCFHAQIHPFFAPPNSISLDCALFKLSGIVFGHLEQIDGDDIACRKEREREEWQSFELFRLLCCLKPRSTVDFYRRMKTFFISIVARSKMTFFSSHFKEIWRPSVIGSEAWSMENSHNSPQRTHLMLPESWSEDLENLTDSLSWSLCFVRTQRERFTLAEHGAQTMSTTRKLQILFPYRSSPNLFELFFYIFF